MTFALALWGLLSGAMAGEEADPLGPPSEVERGGTAEAPAGPVALADPLAEAPRSTPEKQPRKAPKFKVDANGHLKAFGLASFPYDHFLMPEDPSVTGIIDGRLNLSAAWGEVLELELAHAITASSGSGSGGAGFSSGVGVTAPELVELTWVAFDGPGGRIQGRTDRFVLRAHLPQVDVAVGRQPVSFGNGMSFTPLDLVNPFTPAVIDQEYKPGVDAARVDAYVGTSARFTLVGAYQGDWSWEGTSLAAYGQATVGVTDVGLFLAEARATHVIGATMITSVGPVGLHSDVTVNLPHEGQDEDPFVRAVVGALGRPGEDTTLFGEVYLQTNGTFDKDEYLVVLQGERWGRGELWTAGKLYTAVGFTQKVLPLVDVNLSAIVNLRDPSALLVTGATFDVASNATVALGAYTGLGTRPDPVDVLDLVDPTTGTPLPTNDALRKMGLQSEFGFYPPTVYVQVRTYF